jgi:hypothetical protein
MDETLELSSYLKLRKEMGSNSLSPSMFSKVLKSSSPTQNFLKNNNTPSTKSKLLISANEHNKSQFDLDDSIYKNVEDLDDESVLNENEATALKLLLKTALKDKNEMSTKCFNLEEKLLKTNILYNNSNYWKLPFKIVKILSIKLNIKKTSSFFKWKIMILNEKLIKKEVASNIKIITIAKKNFSNFKKLKIFKSFQKWKFFVDDFAKNNFSLNLNYDKIVKKNIFRKLLKLKNKNKILRNMRNIFYLLLLKKSFLKMHSNLNYFKISLIFKNKIKSLIIINSINKKLDFKKYKLKSYFKSWLIVIQTENYYLNLTNFTHNHLKHFMIKNFLKILKKNFLDWKSFVFIKKSNKNKSVLIINNFLKKQKNLSINFCFKKMV